MQMNIPFNILEIVILHHTPFNPNTVDDKRRAKGIRAPVNTVLLIDGIIGFPNPAKAPLVTISTHKNNSDTPNILKYSIPICNTFGSSKKILKIGAGRQSIA